MDYLEIIKKISIIFVSALVVMGMIILYLSIFLSVRKINKLNNEIEILQDNLDKKEIKGIEGDLEFNISGKSKPEKQRIKKIEQEIEKKKRYKKYILEKISMYKIFKK